MRSVLWLVFAACGQGESPVLGEIEIHQSSCARDADSFELGATIEVGLAEGQAIRVAFLPAIEGVRLLRTQSWDCAAWSQIPVGGCVREPEDLEIRLLISVGEVDLVEDGIIPDVFDVRLVATITEAEDPESDLENVTIVERCD